MGSWKPVNMTDRRPHPEKVDRELLYRYLWSKRDPRTNRLNINQRELADQLNVFHNTVRIIIREYLAEGRMSRIPGKGWTWYRLTDPDLWEQGEQATKLIKWG